MSTEKKHEPKNLRDRANWEERVRINSDLYGGATINAAAHVMTLLDEGKTPEEAEEGMHGKELTGFLAGAAASMVARYHERGDEWNDYWNLKYGVPAGTKGTVNPAILTVKE